MNMNWDPWNEEYAFLSSKNYASLVKEQQEAEFDVANIQVWKRGQV